MKRMLKGDDFDRLLYLLEKYAPDEYVTKYVRVARYQNRGDSCLYCGSEIGMTIAQWHLSEMKLKEGD